MTPPKKDEAPPAGAPEEIAEEVIPHPGRVHETLAEAMSWVWGEVRRVKKSGKHPTQGYMFATESDIADLIRELCANAGIVIRQTIEEVAEREIGQTKNGNPITRYTVKVAYTVTNGREDWPEQKWQGQADDSSDKGMAKALTACRKTFLIATFQVSSGDDPDGQVSPEVQRGAGMRRAQGTGKGGGDYPSPTAKADPVTDAQKQEAARIRIVLTHESQGDQRIDGGAFSTFVSNYALNEIGEPVATLNRDQFEILLSKLRDQASKFAPGFDPKTGEWAPGTGPAGAPTSDAPQDPPPAEAPPAPAEAPKAANPAPVPAEHEQKILEQAAAAAEKPAESPDSPSGATYTEAVAVAERAGIDQGTLLGLMMGAGAAAPADLDADPVRQKFLDALDEAVANTSPKEPS